MITAFGKKEEEDFDTKMQMVAWQTALLMNSTGNYKKKIKPEELYTPLEKVKEKEEFSPTKRGELEAELLTAFGLSNANK